MQPTFTSEESLPELVRDLRVETIDLIRQEVRLAKTEMSEKFAGFGRNVVALMLGGFVAYAGAIVLLVGLGFLLSMGLAKLGLDRSIAQFAGLGIVGLLITVIGMIFVSKGVKGFSAENLAPERTLKTAREFVGADETLMKAQFGPQDNRNSEQIQAHIDTTRERMQETAAEITHRLNPRYMGRKVVSEAKSHPGVTAAVGVGTGVLSWLMLRRRHHRRRC